MVLYIQKLMKGVKENDNSCSIVSLYVVFISVIKERGDFDEILFRSRG